MTVQNTTQSDTPPPRPVTIRGTHNIAAWCGKGISHHTVRAAVRSGELPTLAAGRGVVVLTDDLDVWLASLRRRAS